MHFFLSPSSRLPGLTEPPRVVEVRDSQKGPPQNGVLGPYEEGVMVMFTCLARDGEWLASNLIIWHI